MPVSGHAVQWLWEPCPSPYGLSLRRRLEQQAGDVLEDSVIRHESDAEANRRSGNPTIGVVVALMERVPDVLAIAAQASRR
jgi:hypothetical protein